MKTLFKMRISLIDNNKALMLFIWKPYFKKFLPTIIGEWSACGTTHCSGGIGKDHLDLINEKRIASILYDNFILPKTKIKTDEKT
jgi:hypothetical protein